MKKLTIGALAAIAIFACTKTENPTEALTTDNVEVAFNASQSVVVSEVTKASKAEGDPEPLPSSSKALISVYAPGGAYTGATNKVLAKAYTAGAGGVMNADGGKAMLIPIGSYDFFSIGVLGAGAMPTMTATEITGMTNGVDYIAAKENKQLTTATDGKKVAMAYNHLTSLVAITVKADGASIAEVASVTSVTITPSVGPWTVPVSELANPATVNQVATVAAKGAQVPMTVNGTSALFMMMPVVAAQTVYFTIKAQVKPVGAVSAVSATYTGTITVPAGGYTGGNQYGYIATVSSGDVSFSSATVSGWGVGNAGGAAENVPVTEE